MPIESAAEILLLAQDNAQEGTGGSLMGMLPLFAMLAALFYFMVLRPERQKQKKQKDRLGTLKKNDRVVTIGGIHGVVVNIQREADEITLKVDEANNTRIRFSFSSVGRVVSDEDSEDSSESK